MCFSLYLFFQLIETTFLVMNWLFIISESSIISVFSVKQKTFFQNDFKKTVKKKKETWERENGSKCDHGHLLLL